MKATRMSETCKPKIALSESANVDKPGKKSGSLVQETSAGQDVCIPTAWHLKEKTWGQSWDRGRARERQSMTPERKAAGKKHQDEVALEHGDEMSFRSRAAKDEQERCQYDGILKYL